MAMIVSVEKESSLADRKVDIVVDGPRNSKGCITPKLKVLSSLIWDECHGGCIVSPALVTGLKTPRPHFALDVCAGRIIGMIVMTSRVLF